MDGRLSGDLAPGAPGIPPTWTSSAKDVVTTALGSGRVWATMGFGIVNEVYWPSTGQPEIRDLGFIVAGNGAWHEVKRVANYQLSTPHPGVPLPRVVHIGPEYRLEIEVLPDPSRDTLLIQYRLDGEGMALYALLAPHLGASGVNDAWIDGGLHARADGHALFLGSDGGFRRASAGYVGTSDGWQDFARHGRMTWSYGRAEWGNVALMGELAAPSGVLALGFAETSEGARLLARSSLAEGYAPIRERFLHGWNTWIAGLSIPPTAPELTRTAWLSASVLKVHEDRTFPGAVVASLSIPWGQAGDDLGGYHLVWTRDAVETGLAFMAIGDQASACRMLSYLVATQEEDGRWRQNYSSDGRPYWLGVQLDQVALPVLLGAKLRGGPGTEAMSGVERMISLAIGFIARNGPLTPQDRWEETAGVSPYTLAAQIVALVEAAPYLPEPDRTYALDLADYWNERVEDWTYARDSELARRFGVPGHYVRIAPEFADDLRGEIEIKNRIGVRLQADAVVGLDYIYLARLGLRAPDFQPIADTTRIVDAILRVETPHGVAYHRYNEDGYGEHADGRAFDGIGIGRAWPLLAGERAHLELLLGRDVRPALLDMTRMTGPGGLLPEQVWDTDPIPSRSLFPGKPTGGAMPLVWAHSEFLKLLAARDRGRPIEFSDRAWGRWRGRPPQAAAWRWRRNGPFARLPTGRDVWIEADREFVLRFGFDGWQRASERRFAPLPFGMYGVHFPAAELAGRSHLDFTFRWLPDERWEGVDYGISLAG